MSEANKACTEKQYEVTHDQLPLCCPLPDQRIWDAHPRVYLPIEQTGQVTCPYCDAHYVLKTHVAK